MKRLILLLVAAVLVLPSAASAWNVTIKNSCTRRFEVTVKVFGEHLLWRTEVDCWKSVISGRTEVCAMPGGICPVQIEAVDLNSIGCWPNNPDSWVACCFDVNVEVVNSGSSWGCKLK